MREVIGPHGPPLARLYVRSTTCRLSPGALQGNSLLQFYWRGGNANHLGAGWNSARCARWRRMTTRVVRGEVGNLAPMHGASCDGDGCCGAAPRLPRPAALTKWHGARAGGKGPKGRGAPGSAGPWIKMIHGGVAVGDSDRHRPAVPRPSN